MFARSDQWRRYRERLLAVIPGATAMSDLCAGEHLTTFARVLMSRSERSAGTRKSVADEPILVVEVAKELSPAGPLRVFDCQSANSVQAATKSSP
jgi:hypothetical protein